MPTEAFHTQDVCGPYRVARFVGRNRTFKLEFYEAVHQTHGDRMTLAVLSREAAADEALRRRFEAETALFGAIDHPNVLLLLNSGEEDGLPWRAMEFAARGLLRARLDAEPEPMVSAVALCFARLIADALGALHSAGAVHGDLTPESILLTDIDEVKLADLGAAPHALSGLVNGAGVMRAAPRLEVRKYAAPERLDGGPVDARTDVFAAGVILREMLKGQQERSGKLDPKDQRLPDFLEALINKATAQDPGDRYASMADLSEAVNEAWNDLLEQGREGAELEQALATLAEALVNSRGEGKDGEDGGEAANVDALLEKLASAVRGTNMS